MTQRMTAAFTMLAEANLEARTISGVAVPYGEVGFTSWGPTVVEAGAITIPDRVPMLVGHNEDRPIGLMAAHDNTDSALMGQFRIAKTGAGDEALLEADAQIRNGLSVGLDVSKYTTGNDGTTTITAATLREVSLVTFPAFDSARVDTVAASESPETAEATPAEDDSTETAEETTVDESTAVVEATATPNVPRIHVQDGFPYRRGLAASFFGDMLNSQHDVDAAARVRKAQSMMTAAQTMNDVEDLVPEEYRPALYVGQLGVTRPVIDAFQGFSIADAKPFRIPVFSDASDLIDDHVEGANPGDGELAFDNVLVTPSAVSGQYTVSREVIDGSVPGIDAIILNAIRQAYATKSETDVAATILGGAYSGSAIVNGMTLRTNHSTFQSNRKAAADFLLLGTDLYPFLASQTDGADRPMYPYVGPMNAQGTVGRGAYSLNVDGYAASMSWSITGGILGMRSDAAVWESGLQTWRWEEVAGPANIRFAAFGYIAAAVLRQSGVMKFLLD